MKFEKTVNLSAVATKGHFSFSVGVQVALAVLVMSCFFSMYAVAGIQPNQETIHREMHLDKEKEGETGGQTSMELPGDSGCRQVRVGIFENRPKIYTDESGVVSGIFAAILKEIAQEENWQVTYIPCQWDKGLDALKKGRIDLIPDVAYSPEREELFDFHKEAVITSWSVVYSNSRNGLMKISDLDGRRVAILKDSIHHIYLAQLVNGFGFKVTFVEADSFEEAFKLVAKGDAEAAVTNHLFGDSFHKQYGLIKTPIVFNPVSLFFATASGSNPDLLQAVDKNVRRMKSEPGSAYYRSVVSWMEEAPMTIVPWYYVWILAGISGLLILAVLFVVLLRWQVRAGTRNLAQANRLLGNSEKKFRDLFQEHSAVKLLIDPVDGSIIEANKAAEEFYGWSGEQLRRIKIQEIDTLSTEEVKAEREKTRPGKVFHSELCHQLADGSFRNVAVFCSEIDIEGKPLIHAIIHDITAQSKLESQLRQAHKMEAIGRLAGGVAHDYNNMLSVILGYTELALQKTDPSEPLHEDLKRVFEAARRSTDITRQLLAFARKQNVVPKVADLNETVEGMLKMIRRLIGENIELDWEPRAGLWYVKIDPAQVDQIMVNLCLNSRDSIADVGTITIKTDNAIIDETFCLQNAGSVPGEFVLLSVTDDGCGMDQETLSHVFEPFYTTKGIGKGTGLGLATVYGIVKQNDGYIKVESDRDKGTAVKIYLPRNTGKMDKKRVESTAEVFSAHGETVLLVEDEQAIREMSRRILENIGYHVLEASTPGEAMRIARERNGGFDLLLTDVVMPEMNGSDLADQLYSLCSGFETLFMSGYPATVIGHGVVVEKGVNFIQKPFSQQELAARVNEVLGRASRSAS